MSLADSRSSNVSPNGTLPLKGACCSGKVGCFLECPTEWNGSISYSFDYMLIGRLTVTRRVGGVARGAPCFVCSNFNSATLNLPNRPTSEFPAHIRRHFSLRSSIVCWWLSCCSLIFRDSVNTPRQAKLANSNGSV